MHTTSETGLLELKDTDNILRFIIFSETPPQRRALFDHNAVFKEALKRLDRQN